jgi:NTP pyrophosphatase (non-canonical NTP hydrolase)
MNLNEYQQRAQRTAQPGHPQRPHIAAMGLAGEAGEVVDLLKKHLGHGHELDRDKLRKELGDVLWYVAELASCYGMELGDIAQANIHKLETRYPSGFSTERSVNRNRGVAR